MVCKACSDRKKTWVGSDPRCAFDGDEFGENWNCATVSKIRLICDDDNTRGVDMVRCEDQNYATVKVGHIEGIDGDPLALWVSWYKRRGATDAMWLLFEDAPPRRPTEAECLLVAAAYGVKEEWPA